MKYQVVPFKANVSNTDGASVASGQLETLINEQVAKGWQYERLESLSTDIITPAVAGVPGKAGCAGIGYVPDKPGIPERRNTTEVYVAVFRRED